MANTTVLPRRGEAAHHGPEGVPGLDVEGDGRLVEHQQLAGSTPARARTGPAASARPTASACADRRRRGGRRRASTSSTPSGSGKSDAIIVISSRTERSRISPPVCSMTPTAPALIASGGRHPEQHDVAPIRSAQAEHHVDRRRLAGAVGAEQGHGLSRRHRDVDAVDGPHRAVRLGQVDELRQRCWAGWRRPSS